MKNKKIKILSFVIISTLLLNLGIAVNANSFKNLGFFSSDSNFTTSFSSTSSINALVLLIEFKDLKNTNSAITPKNLYNHYFYNDATMANPYGSLSYYYNESSKGKFSISGEIMDWYTAPLNRAEYKNPAKLEELIVDAIVYNINSKKINISDFDSDKNGVLDALYIQFAGGYDNSFTDYTANMKHYNKLKIGGITISNYVMLGNTKLSKIIHETGHLLGIPDFYYQSDNKNVFGLGGLDMMDGAIGDHNAFTKLALNWANETVITEKQYDKTIKLNMSTKNNDCIVIPATDPKTYLPIYYVVEYLLPTGVWKSDLAINNIYHGGLRILKVNPTLTDNKKEFLFNNNDLVSLITPPSHNSVLSTDNLFFEGFVRLPSGGKDIYIENIKLKNTHVEFNVTAK